MKKKLIAVKLQVYSCNFKIKKMPMKSLSYSFYLANIYLINQPTASVSISKKKTEAHEENKVDRTTTMHAVLAF